MIAAKLIVDPNKGTLQELIDAHNILVRSLFPNAASEVPLNSRNIDSKPSRFDASTPIVGSEHVHPAYIEPEKFCRCVVPTVGEMFGKADALPTGRCTTCRKLIAENDYASD